MPPKKKTEPDVEFPTVRVCATDEVNERLLRTVPGYAEARSAIEDRTSRILSLGAAALRTGCTEIPVVVHVLHRTTAENLSDAQINSQIDILNDDFRATNADKSSTPAVFQPLIGDARITFKLATTDPSGNPTTGIVRTSTNEHVVQLRHRQRQAQHHRRRRRLAGGQVPQRLDLRQPASTAPVRPARLRAVPGRPRRHRRRGDPAQRLRQHRHRVRAVQPRPHRHPRGRALAEPAAHLGRRRNRLHGQRLRGRHPERGRARTSARRPSRTSRATTGPTATCS